MYLIVFGNSPPKQVTENLTICDLLAGAEGICQIFRAKPDHFEKLVFDKTASGVKSTWVPVKEARVLSCSTGQIHS